ncbi:formate dehydrogenase-N subunit alpha [Pseudomonas sp. PA-3-10C]|uniref:formate dehydrogenase-N subunit alpha n=5 Tax=Pseudomonas TaxID=286 RepID=UPI001F46A884|nr:MULTISPECIES: formate dehydrogenase-N subunit alpha [unclassified Pseudomonas]MCF5510843.1 formate dehydrogenase-N subunit alpha [Pseudomonas sp. PA-3-6H]MCF5564896.1 formate dehydrogenase-N subunit alpha [Pseudomonas sp. PA-3-5D]MCF5596537.1 formate dehydrogenase-N subunit alpha [Pseudomonas sp. PA-3-10C]
MQIGRRQFFKICSVGIATATVASLGFAPGLALATESRQYKLLRAKETRNNCTYCSVGCGLLMYSLGDGAKNAKARIFHIEGDPDHPVSRGSLCPKGAGLIDYIHSEQRLLFPEYRAPGSDQWQRISWEHAIERIARLMKDDRDANFIERNAKGTLVNRWLTTGMLCSSAASSETGSLDQRFTRALGMLGTDSQARVCHAPTVSALAPTFGRGAMSNNWVDIKNANVVLIMGGNPAEAHPVGFKWVIEAKIHNGAKVIVVDPRFNRSAAVADIYSPIRAGSDVTFLMGVVNYLITHDKVQHEYVRAYTNASLIVKDSYSFDDGLFSGYDATKHAYDRSSWTYELDEHGFAKRDLTLTHPRCVWNLLKEHVSRYTPEMVTNVCGTPTADFLKIAEILGETSAPNKTATFLYALGWTHHTNGAQMIRGSGMIQMLLGNIGMAGGGVNALRGHANIQGYTDLGLLSLRLPGYMNLPSDKQTDIHTYLKEITPVAQLPDQVNYYKNMPKFFVSLMKSLWGDHATKENDWGFDWLPKWDESYDVLNFSNRMFEGKVNGYIAQGFNPIAAFPDKNKASAALAKLKFLVIIDPLATETSSFWKNHGEFNDVDTASIQTEVFRLPSSCFAEENGSIVNSGRWLQWHWAGAAPPGEAWQDGRILGELFMKIRELYEKEGGANPAPVLNMAWNYHDPLEPQAEEVAKEFNGYALADLHDEHGNLTRRKGQLLDDFSQLKDDGSTACFNWVFCGSWTEQGNQMARRDNTDTGLGCTPGWAWSWPQNRRILYNRASADPQGKPWDPKRKVISWDGERWSGIDVPDYPIHEPPGSNVNPFIMLPEGLGRLFSCAEMNDGPFPEHYEPIESPLVSNPLHPNVTYSPTARLYESDRIRMGTRDEFPYVATTYSITELFRHWTKHSRINAILQPEQFIEIGEKLAKEKGIVQGDTVRVTTKRGFIKAKAVVTKRIRRLAINGQEVDTIGIPCHWGYEGSARKGFLANTLTPGIGESNSHTPEYKAFLVNIEKV